MRALSSHWNWHIVALLVLFGVGSAVRFAYLEQPVRGDEAVTAFSYMQLPLSEALVSYTLPNNHLLHTFLAHYSVQAFGDNLTALRLPTFVAGLALMLLTYAVGRKLYSPNVGLLAMALVGANTMLILYSSNARGYTLQTCLILLLVLCRDAVLKGKRWGVIAFAILSALGFYTIPTMLYAYVGLGLWLLASVWWQENRLQSLLALTQAVTLAVLLTVLLYAPVLLNSGLDVIRTHASQFHPNLTLDNLASLAFRVFVYIHEGWSVVAIALVFGGAILGLAMHRWLSRDRLPLPVFLLSGVLVVLVLTRFNTELFERIFIFFIPFYVILASAGLMYGVNALFSGQVATQNPFLSMVVMVLGALLAFSILQSRAVEQSTETAAFPEAPQLAQVLAQTMQEDALYIGAFSEWATVSYYLRYSSLFEQLTPNYFAQNALQERLARHPFDFPVVYFTVDEEDLAQTITDYSTRYGFQGSVELVQVFSTTNLYRLTTVPITSGVYATDALFDNALNDGITVDADAGRVTFAPVDYWRVLGYGKSLLDVVFSARVTLLNLSDEGAFGLRVRAGDDGTSVGWLYSLEGKALFAEYVDKNTTWTTLAFQPFALEVGVPVLLEVVAVGEAVEFFADGRRIASAVVPLRRGDTALLVSPNVQVAFDNFSLMPAAFETPPAITSTFVTADELYWQVDGYHEYVNDPDGNAVLLMGGDNWVVLSAQDSDNWGNYSLETRLKALEPAPEGSEWLLQFRHRDGVGTYTLAFDQETQQMSFNLEENGAWLGTLATADVPRTPDGWHVVFVVVEGDTLIVRVDGNTLLTLADASFPRGGVRLLVPPSAKVMVDDVRIRPRTTSTN
jgi:4-amino-4-deoxy-L-arabinose transferase-like glycosyltransferase